MSVGRLRGGELLAGVGAMVLLVSLFLPWFGVDFGSEASSDGIVNLVVTTGAPAATGWNTVDENSRMKSYWKHSRDCAGLWQPRGRMACGPRR